MQRILIMAARALGPILITKLLRGRRKKRHEDRPDANPDTGHQ